MKNLLWLAVVVALGSGVAIGAQSNLTNLSGRAVGAVRTGLLINLMGGTVAGAILLLMTLNGAFVVRDVPRQTVMLVAVAGIIGITIIMGVAYALPRTGLAAGFAGIILGQMVVGVLVDTLGFGGAEPLPLDLRRVVGLVVMAAAVYLLLPRT